MFREGNAIRSSYGPWVRENNPLQTRGHGFLSFLGEQLFVKLSVCPPNATGEAFFAVGFGAWDASVMMGARAFELALDAKYCSLLSSPTCGSVYGKGVLLRSC